MIDPQAGAGTVATVYSDRVAALAREVRIDGADLLGLAMAHELGHLLIGTDEHAARGLMRAVWTRTELQRNAAEDWMFSETEMEAMRRAARIRSIGPTLGAAVVNRDHEFQALCEPGYFRSVAHEHDRPIRLSVPAS